MLQLWEACGLQSVNNRFVYESWSRSSLCELRTASVWQQSSVYPTATDRVLSLLCARRAIRSSPIFGVHVETRHKDR